MTEKNNRFTWGELLAIVGIVSVLAAILVSFTLRGRELSKQSTCQTNLKQWGAIFKMYASESKGYYPRCATKNERTNTNSPGHGFVTAPYGPSLYPHYVSDLNIYFCTSTKVKAKDYTNCPGGRWCNINTGTLDARNFDDCSYTYFGWFATNENEFAGLIACLLVEDHKDPLSDPQTADKDFTLDDFGGAAAVQATLNNSVGSQSAAAGVSLPAPTGLGGSSRILRLKEGSERFLIDDWRDAGTCQSWIPIMWERANDDTEDCPHVPSGGNVLYMDGHVEFKEDSYRKYPITKECAALSRLID